jgi:hypothetical protein
MTLRCLALLGALGAVTATVLCGCSASVQSAATTLPRAAVPVVVDESLNAMETPVNLERVRGIVATPQMDQTIRDAARSATRGAMAGLTEERAALMYAVNETAAGATRSAVRATADELPLTVAPAVREAFVSTLESPDVRAALDTATAEATRAALLTSHDVIRQLHEEQGGAVLLARLQRWVVICLIVACALGTTALAVFVWAMRRMDASRMRELRELLRH